MDLDICVNNHFTPAAHLLCLNAAAINKGERGTIIVKSLLQQYRHNKIKNKIKTHVVSSFFFFAGDSVHLIGQPGTQVSPAVLFFAFYFFLKCIFKTYMVSV